VRADVGGRSLLPPVVVEENFIQSAGGTSSQSSTWLVRLQPAERTEKEISRLDVIWKTMYPVEVEEITFDTPVDTEGVSRKVGPFIVTFESCKRDSRGGTGLEAKVVVQADVSNLSQEILKSLQEVPLARRLLNEVEVDGLKGMELFKVVEGAEGPYKVMLRTWLFGNQSPKTIKFRVAKRAIMMATPLSFANIPLPEEPR
jgi:hypothetical protein